jgi:hypothetical protein
MPIDFAKEFDAKLKERGCKFEVRGLLTGDDKILTLGNDTKVLSTVFELFCFPLVKEVADKHNLKLVVPEAQTVYPDFTLMTDENDKAKIAVDVKTTYRRANGTFFYTHHSFGTTPRTSSSHTAPMRNTGLSVSSTAAFLSLKLRLFRWPIDPRFHSRTRTSRVSFRRNTRFLDYGPVAATRPTSAPFNLPSWKTLRAALARSLPRARNISANIGPTTRMATIALSKILKSGR